MIQDFRHALRAVAGMPLLSAVIVLSLAVGIGVNTAVFSWLQAVVVHPLPGVVDSGGLRLVEPRADSGSYPGVSWLEYDDLKRWTRSLGASLAFRMVPLSIGESGQTARAYALLVSGDYFATLGLTPALGRFIREDEALRPGGEPVMVVSYDYWQTRLGGARDVVGRTLRVNDHMITIVGVTPPRFQGTVLGLNFDVWMPATMAPALFAGSRELEDRSVRGYSMMARLRAPQAAAQAELDASMRDLARLFPSANAGIKAELLPFWQAPRGPQRMLAQALMILQGVMLLLLLVVCSNTANLVLARASTRQREVGVRLALGARAGRIAALLLMENFILALAGAALGVALAMWGTTALRAVPMISTFPIKLQTSVDGTAMLFAIALACACGLGFGLLPAVQLAGVDPLAALRSAARSASRSRLRHALMGVEVALAVIVLMAAALLLRSFAETREIDPGFTREGVLLAAYDLTGHNYPAAETRSFAARLLDRARAINGVESAAIATAVPLDIHGLPMRSFTIEGRARSEETPDRALSNVVSSGYFATMRVPILTGSDFVEILDEKAPPQAIVNEEFVRRFVGSGEVIGRGIETRGAKYTIVGVVRNSLSDSFGEAATPVIYLSYRDRPSQQGEIHVRTRSGREEQLAPELQRIVRDLDPELPLYDVRTLSEHIEKNLFLRRIPARMFAVLGPLLLLLAAVGIYAVVDFVVSRRTVEIGIRVACGATPTRVAAEVARESLRFVAAGLVAGWLVVFLVALHLLQGAINLPVFAGVPVLLMLVATVACWLPARRASRVDPLVALRQE
jgi:predicted permease